MKVLEFIVEKYGHEFIALYILTFGIVLSCVHATEPIGHDLVAAGLMGLKLSSPSGNGTNKV